MPDVIIKVSQEENGAMLYPLWIESEISSVR